MEYFLKYKEEAFTPVFHEKKIYSTFYETLDKALNV